MHFNEGMFIKMGESLTLEALKFMILGMSVVFVFLSILIFLLNIQSKLINRFFAPVTKKTASIQTPASQKSQTNQVIEEEIVAVITAAVKRFREKKSTT